MYESRWAILSSGTNRIRWSSQSLLSQIYQIFLSTFKNLKPATIAGFAAAIADHLYLFGQELRKSLDLYRPIASVYREKPTANRGVASRDLPLLLLVFTKGSLLTFKGGQSKKV